MKDIFVFTENLISGTLPFSFLIICGLYLTLRGGFFQFTRLFESFKLVVKAFLKKKKHTDNISSLQCACTALSATVGTGNIAGVAGAIALGGAGAVFWMWVSAFLGMAVKFTEISLSILYRKKESTYRYSGGPMYYITMGLNKKFKPLAIIFAAVCIPAALCTGNITQTNAAVTSISSNVFIKAIVGIIFAILAASVITGGAKRIGAVTEKIVPIMSLLYIVLCSGVIFLNLDFLATAFKMIFIGAFHPAAVTGGVVGSVSVAALTGAGRGVFSNEAGLGTSAIAHAEAYDADAETQGLFGLFEVFVDTILICTITALTILCSRVNINYGSIASSELVNASFKISYGNTASFLLSAMLCFFAFSSVIGWALYGEVSCDFLFGAKGKRLFLIFYPFACIVGAIMNVEVAWRISAFFNGIMLCCNLPSILLLDPFKTHSKEGRFNDRRKN